MDLRQQLTPSLSALAWRNKGKMLLAFALVLAGGLVYLSLAERLYLSEAKMFVRPGRESVTVDPIVTNGQTVTVADSRESEINGIAEMLHSRALLEKVVDQLSPEAILEKEPGSKSMGDYLAPLDSVNLNPAKVYSLRDKAIRRMTKNLRILTSKKSSIVTLSYEARDPALAKLALENLLKIAQEEHARVNQTRGSQPFYETQKGKLKEQVTGLEEQLRKLKNESGLSSFEKQRELHLIHVATLEGEIAKAQYGLKAAEDEALHRRQTLAGMKPLVETSQITDQPIDPKADMRKKLYDLQLKEADLASKLTEVSPLLIQVRGQIAAARKVVDDEDQTTQKTLATNPAFGEMQKALHDRDAQVVALKATVTDLSTKIAEGKSRLESLNDKEVEIARLQRELDLASVNYKKYAENEELARINDEVEAAKISSINLLQPPSFSETPASPDLKVGIPAVLLAALFASVGCGLLAEWRRRPLVIRREEEPEDDEPEPEPAPSRRPRREAVPAQPR
jgi:polysaccharide biosynthesis protein PslE